MILLADNEIRQELDKLPNGNLFLPSAYEETSIAWNEFIARTQLKKVVEWLDKECDEHPEHNAYDDGLHFNRRRDCQGCLPALKKEAGG